MSKKKKKPGVPGGMEALRRQLNHAKERTLLLHDVLFEARVELMERRKLTPQLDAPLKVQLGTVKAILSDAFNMSEDEKQRIRKRRLPDAFKGEVDKMFDRMAPTVILSPTGTRLRKLEKGV